MAVFSTHPVRKGNHRRNRSRNPGRILIPAGAIHSLSRLRRGRNVIVRKTASGCCACRTSSEYVEAIHPRLTKSLASFHLSHFSDDGPNKRGSQIPLARNMVPSSILLYVSDHPLRSNVEASCLSAVNHIICLRFLRFHIKLHFLEI